MKGVRACGDSMSPSMSGLYKGCTITISGFVTKRYCIWEVQDCLIGIFSFSPINNVRRQH